MNATETEYCKTILLLFFLSRDESLNSIAPCNYLKEEKNNLICEERVTNHLMLGRY